MFARQAALLMLVGVVGAAPAQAQTFEIVRELGTPQHFYFNDPDFFTSASDALPVPAAPNVPFAITDYNTVRLRLIAPAGKKFVCTQPVYLSWPGDLNLVPVGSMNSGPLHVCPTSWSFTTLAGTAPVSTVEGFKTDGDWLKIRSTGTSASSANFEFTEIVLNWDVTAFSGPLHTYTMFDGGGWISGPEIDLYQALALGAPDPGPAVFLEDIFPPCTPSSTTWPVCGAPVAVRPGADYPPSVAADGFGGVFVTYPHVDSVETGNADIWLNYLDSDGNQVVGWPASGVPVCEAARDQQYGRVVADGSGGAYVAWMDNRNDPNNFFYDVYVQRITASGSVAPGWPVDGVCAHMITPTSDEFLRGLGDGVGGVFVLMSGSLNRIAGSGTIDPNWPENGLAIASNTSRLLSDGAGGAYLGWNSGTDVRLVRVTAASAIAPGWTAAGLVVGTPASASSPIEIAMSGDHVSVAWLASGEVRASRVTSGGSIQPSWGSNGVLIRTAIGTLNTLFVTPGGASGDIVVVWREGVQVWAQRITPIPTFAPGWPVQGWQVLADGGNNLRAMADCDGGTTLAFTKTGTRAIRFTPAGTVAPGWPSDGVLLCGGTLSTVGTYLDWVCPDGTGGIITAVSRVHQGPGNAFNRADIHAMCVRGDGSLDAGYAGGTAVGSNVQVVVGPATVTFPSVTTAGETRLELTDSGPPPPWGLQTVPTNPSLYYEVTTAAAYQGPVQVCITYDPLTVQGPESGLQLLHYDASTMPPAWVNVTTSLDENANVICGSTPTLSPFAIVEADPTDVNAGLPRTVRLFANVPNPFNPTTTIHYEMPVADHVQLDVLDVRGRLVQTLVNGPIEGGHHTAVWQGMNGSGQRMASGIYLYRLRTGSFVETRRMVLLK